jgi:hypothetical protein
MVTTISLNFHDWKILADRRKCFSSAYNIQSYEQIRRCGVKVCETEP